MKKNKVPTIIDKYKELLESSDELTIDKIKESEYYQSLSTMEKELYLGEITNYKEGVEKEYQPYQIISNNEIEEEWNKLIEDVEIKVINIKCPVCGKEIITSGLMDIDPTTNDTYVKYNCDCGNFLAKFETHYPRYVVCNKKGEILDTLVKYEKNNNLL